MRSFPPDWRAGVAISETLSPTARPRVVSSIPCLMISARTFVASAKGEPDADFPRAHAHGVGNDAVEPEARERQRHKTKQHSDFGREPDRDQLGTGVVLGFSDLGDWQDGIDVLDRFPDRPDRTH